MKPAVVLFRGLAAGLTTLVSKAPQHALPAVLDSIAAGFTVAMDAVAAYEAAAKARESDNWLELSQLRGRVDQLEKGRSK